MRGYFRLAGVLSAVRIGCRAVWGAGVLPAAGAELRAGAGHGHVPGLGQGAGVTLGASLQHVVTPGLVSL